MGFWLNCNQHDFRGIYNFFSLSKFYETLSDNNTTIFYKGAPKNFVPLFIIVLALG